jgi:hypothetical protein
MTQPAAFNESATERLQKFLAETNGENFGGIAPLTPDASTREYFRIGWANKTAIACVYSEPFVTSDQSYLDVTALFRAAELPVAEVLAADGALGVIVHEDFGDRVLRSVLEAASEAERENLIDDAVRLIARIQAATAKAFEIDSIAARLAFDEEKLGWELNFFTAHYFGSLRGEVLLDTDAAALRKELAEVAQELAARPHVLCHRDFHAANLMLDAANRLVIIDHQDARMGAASYDLVSLLLDRVSAPPAPAWIREKISLLLAERQNLNLAAIDADEFAGEFELMTVQRCLKAIGTFSFQTAVRGKKGYTQFINPMFLIVLQTAERLDRFPVLQKIIRERI